MRNKWISYILVTAQFGLISILVWYCRFSSAWLSLILLMIAASLGLLAIASMQFKVSVLPDVRSSQTLITGGPYRFIRHPMYTAVLIACQALMLNRPDVISAFMWLLLLVVLLIKMSYEEQQLARRFKTYSMYMTRTKRLIPFVY